MSDTIVEKKGFGTRMKNGFSGILTGILFVLIGIGVLVWNEKSNVTNIHDVKELKSVYVDVESDKVAKDYDGSLIVTSGKLDFGDEELVDPAFNIRVKTPALVRKVEMYQWVEEKEESDDKTTYNYKKEWKSDLVDSTEFKDSNNHYNPDSMPYEGTSTSAAELKVGAYTLSSSFGSLVSTNKKVSDLTNATIPEGYQVYNNYIVRGEDPEKPQVGDIRISFEYASYSDVTVMGKLHGDTIIEYVTKEKTRIKYFSEGTQDGATIIANMEKGNKAMKWIIRLVGTLIIIIGVKSLFGPLTALSSYVPILRNIVNGATGIISFFVGLAIALVTIAISWIVFRPVLGICLLAGAIVLIILAKKFGTKKGQPVQTVPQPAMQPGQPVTTGPVSEPTTAPLSEDAKALVGDGLSYQNQDKDNTQQ